MKYKNSLGLTDHLGRVEKNFKRQWCLKWVLKIKSKSNQEEQDNPRLKKLFLKGFISSFLISSLILMENKPDVKSFSRIMKGSTFYAKLEFTL